MVAASELNYNLNASATQMAETIFGDSVTVTGASYTGSWYASGTYSGGDSLAPGATPSDSGVILSTGVASWYTNSSGEANQNTATSYNTGGPNGDADFDDVAGATTYDASYLEVDFIPTGDTMTMQFVFASDEFPEYSNTVYNDMVGVWINGQHVPLSVTQTQTAVGEVNQNENINLYKDNTSDQYNTEMDGLTVTMTLTIPVNPDVVNSIKIGVADVTDSAWDSNLLIAADSVQTALVAIDDSITMQEGTTQTLDVLGNDLNPSGGTLEVTHINGVAVSAGDTVTLPSGQSVTLNADGTFEITTDTDTDTVSFTYGIEAVNPAGNAYLSDTGFVTVETIPCFVAGTLIRTPDGEAPVETLQAGDLVLTQDDGPQPLRWTGSRRVAARGELAPIRIAAGALGDHGTLLVSPQHRVFLNDTRAELLFGENEVLVAAKHLVNDTTIRPAPGGEVEYVHLLFDSHQVICSNGLLTESFLPGPQTTSALEDAVVAEICTLFPELDPQTGAGYSSAARRTLRAYEARLLTREPAA